MYAAEVLIGRSFHISHRPACMPHQHRTPGSHTAQGQYLPLKLTRDAQVPMFPTWLNRSFTLSIEPLASMQPSPRQRKQSSPHVTPAVSQKSFLQLKVEPTQRLLSYNEVPEWYSDNPHILTGYRPISNSNRACLSSLFYLHNESINIYSHLIPAILFFLAEWTLYQYVQIWYPYTPVRDQIIFAFFLLTATICLGLSATFHTLMNHSEHICHFWLQLGFIGIVILTLGDFVSGINMVFYCEHDLKRIYWGMVCTSPFS